VFGLAHFTQGTTTQRAQRASGGETASKSRSCAAPNVWVLYQPRSGCNMQFAEVRSILAVQLRWQRGISKKGEATRRQGEARLSRVGASHPIKIDSTHHRWLADTPLCFIRSYTFLSPIRSSSTPDKLGKKTSRHKAKNSRTVPAHQKIQPFVSRAPC